MESWPTIVKSINIGNEFLKFQNYAYICYICLRPIPLNNQGEKNLNIKLYKSNGFVAKT